MNSRVNDLLLLLYKSAIDDGLLEEFLNEVSKTTDTHHVGLLFQDNLNPERSRMICNSEGKEVGDLYSRYAGENIFLDTARPYISSGTVIRTNTKLDDKELRNSPFYRHFCAKTDIYHTMGASIRVDNKGVDGLTLNRQESAPFTEEDQAWGESLVPHLQTFMAIRERIQCLESARDTAWEALNLQPFGVLILNSRQQVVFANEALHTIAKTSSILSWRGTRLLATRNDVMNWMDSTINGIVREPDSLGPGRAVQVEAEEEKLHIMIAPLMVESPFGDQVYCVVFVSDVYSETTGIEQYLMDLYSLTPKEAEIACLLIQGYSAKEVAQVNNIQPSTVMTHKKRIFCKAGVHRQSQLVRIGLSLNVAPAHNPVL